MRSFDLRSLKDDMVNVNGGYVLSTVALVGASDFNAAHFAAHWKEGAFDAVIAVDGGFASLAAVDVYGALGGRLDHTVANLQLLASFAERGLAVAAVGERERIAFLVGPGELRLPALPSGIVSVFSLTDVSTGVVEEGLKYGLDGVALTNRTSWGLSNELVGTPARIALESGTLAVFLPL